MEWGQVAVQIGTALIGTLLGGGVVAAFVSNWLDRRNYARLRVDAIVDQVRRDVLDGMRRVVDAHWKLLSTGSRMPHDTPVSDLDGASWAKICHLASFLAEARLAQFYLPGPVIEVLARIEGSVIDARTDGSTVGDLVSTLWNNQHELIGVCRRMRQRLAPLPKDIEDNTASLYEALPRYESFRKHHSVSPGGE